MMIDISSPSDEREETRRRDAVCSRKKCTCVCERERQREIARSADGEGNGEGRETARRKFAEASD